MSNNMKIKDRVTENAVTLSLLFFYVFTAGVKPVRRVRNARLLSS